MILFVFILYKRGFCFFFVYCEEFFLCLFFNELVFISCVVGCDLGEFGWFLIRYDLVFE